MMNLRRITTIASDRFGKFVQLTEEKFGIAEKTEYSEEYISLSKSVDDTKLWTEKFLYGIMEVLEPNPAKRAEERFLMYFEKDKIPCYAPIETLGNTFAEASLKLDSDSEYSQFLSKCAKMSLEMGKAEQSRYMNVWEKVIKPLNKFLKEDMIEIQKKRQALETSRIPLDICKNKIKNETNEAKAKELQTELTTLMNDFDEKMKTVIKAHKEIIEGHKDHKQIIKEFFKEQQNYFAKSQSNIQTLTSNV